MSTMRQQRQLQGGNQEPHRAPKSWQPLSEVLQGLLQSTLHSGALACDRGRHARSLAAQLLGLLVGPEALQVRHQRCRLV